MEASYEVGEISEPDIERNLGNRLFALAQQTRRVTQPRADQILVRGHAENTLKETQKMKGTEPNHAGGIVEINRLTRIHIYP